MAWEVIDNSFDEYECGNATSIHVRLHRDGSLSCEDDGGGIPVDPLMPTDPRPWVEVVCTEIHAGGRFQRKRYGEGIGFGVGLVAVNALSEWLVVETTREGRRWRIRLDRGTVTQSLTDLGPTSRGGSRVWFKPDPAIFGGVQLNYGELSRRLRVESCLWPGITCSVFDDAGGRHETFHSTEGVADLVRAHTAGAAPSCPDVIRIQGREGPTALDCAVQYVGGAAHVCDAYVNGIRLTQGGTVVTGFRRGLASVIRNRARDLGLLGEKELTAEHCLAGLVAVMAVRLAQPHFEGPTMSRISNPELLRFTGRTVAEGLEEYFREHPQTANRIVEIAVAGIS
jgi:DNA gyrase subunit B